METQDIINYYANLLIFQYLGLPNAYATIQALVKMVIADQLPIAVQNAYNLVGDSIAIGAQLDVLGKYAGVTRSGIGFNGPVSLDDEDFLTLIQMATIRNHSTSDLGSIVGFMTKYFPGEVLTYDYKNMRMSYLINSSIGSQNLIGMFISEGLLPKPNCVQLASPIYAPNLDIFFGMVNYNPAPYGASPYYQAPVRAQPFNSYANPSSTNKWLSYASAVNI